MRSRARARAGPRLWALVGSLGCCAPEQDPAPVVVDRSGAAARGPARRDDRSRSPALRDLEANSAASQDRTPVEQFVLVLDGYTNAKRDVARVPEAIRQRRQLFYCAPLNVEFSQCLLFDGADAGAHLTGIEYVISADLYKTLPQVERQYWHAHIGEVDSGILIAPGVDDAAHRALMGELRTTYGKAWRTWDTHHDTLPLGEPTLMWSIAPGKLDPQVRTEMRGRRGW
jgi:hypothetical protein